MATCDQPGDSCTSGPRRQPARVVEEGPKGGCTQAFELLCCEWVTIMIWITENSYPNSRRIRGPHPIAADVAAYEKHVQPSCQQAGITRGGR
jgi:hypothetical protein